MTRKTKLVFGAATGVLGAIVLSAGLFVFLIVSAMPDFRESEHLSDEVLIDNFRQHRTEFDEIRSMLISDDLISRIDDNWANPKNIPDTRLAEYRRLFDIVGTPRGISADLGRDEIRFIASARGWVGSGSSKGYVFLRVPPIRTVEDLDRYHEDEGGDLSEFRHIEGNWYLYFER